MTAKPPVTNAVMPYLFFAGRCEEALVFYQRAAGAEIDMILRFHESPEPLPPGMIPEGFADKVMHAAFRLHGTTILASDGCTPEDSQFKGFSLCLSIAKAEEAQKIFTALSDGGAVNMPLGKTFFSPCYGMLRDRFGVDWMILVPAP
jgi:PhnB protein